MSNNTDSLKFFISDNPDIKTFFRSKIGEISLLKNIFSFIPLLIKWKFKFMFNKHGIIYSFESYFYASNILDCWRCFQRTIKKKYIKLLTFEIFLSNTTIIDNNINYKFNNSYTIKSDLIIIPCSYNTRNIIITHHRYIDSIKNKNELLDILQDYNKYYQTERKCYYNIYTRLFDNLDSKSTISNFIINHNDLDSYNIYTYLNTHINRTVRINHIYKNCYIDKYKHIRFKNNNNNKQYGYDCGLAKDLRVIFIKP